MGSLHLLGLLSVEVSRVLEVSLRIPNTASPTLLMVLLGLGTACLECGNFAVEKSLEELIYVVASSNMNIDA